MSKAYLNALFEEGSRTELFDWLCKLDAERDALRDTLRKVINHPLTHLSGDMEIQVNQALSK